jgi:hypothetical protein
VGFWGGHTPPPPNHILASNLLLKKKHFLVAQLPDYMTLVVIVLTTILKVGYQFHCQPREKTQI